MEKIKSYRRDPKWTSSSYSLLLWFKNLFFWWRRWKKTFKWNLCIKYWFDFFFFLNYKFCFRN